MTDVEDRVEHALHVLAERLEPDVAAGASAARRHEPVRRARRPVASCVLESG